ncbi:hypothetical protein QTP86_013053 [Hemibagrus guttatus]|nr:hypothetical protein QTP86_013053 [Hemibagrus guttatus]
MLDMELPSRRQRGRPKRRYVRFLKDLLESAEQHFMVGYRVHYYVFTDLPDEVPTVALGEGRQLTMIKTASSNRWQEISLRRMEMIEKLIEDEVINKAEYIFSLDVDSKFYAHWGAESLGDLVGALHSWFFGKSREQFTYERRPESQAFIPLDEGDYYYGGAVIGGRPDKVLKLVKTCRMQLDVDRANKIKAVWQEESHLNKYFLYNKPTKVFSQSTRCFHDDQVVRSDCVGGYVRFDCDNITVATTFFALGKYVRFLKDLLKSAEQHCMMGYRVHYYVFTDLPDEVPTVALGEGRQLTVIKTASSNRWQEISLRRMEMIEKLIEDEVINKADYIFSLDVDSKFYAHWGAESLGDLVGALHSWFFGKSREQFTYERRPESQAFIPLDEGDYYYGGAVIGGRPDKVLKLVKTCRMQLDVDRANKI